MTGKPHRERERTKNGKEQKGKNNKSNEVRKRESQIKRGISSARDFLLNY